VSDSFGRSLEHLSVKPGPSSSTTPGAFEERIALSGRGTELVLNEDGLQVTSPRRRLRSPVIPYCDITHFSPARHGFWLGTRRDILSFRRSRFRDPDGPERLAEGISRAIARQPYGLEQLARIAQVETLARRPASLRVGRWLSLFCVLVYILQLRDPFVEQVAVLNPLLVDAGQLWRVVSANFLHGVSVVPLHLIFNLLGLLGLALLVERPLGPARTIVVMGASGLAAMLASYALGPLPVMGASGIVMGLAGSAICLEFHHGDRLPVWWRVPRRPFVALLLMEGVMGMALPFVAGEAHLGGFVAGYFSTRFMAGQAVMLRPPAPVVRRLGWGVAILTAVAVVNVGTLVLRESHALTRYARQLLATPELGAGIDNEVAWRMATESDADAGQLMAAQELAERAADLTEYGDPTILDTLAEVLFVRGERDAALRVIDEAIRITRGEDYYVQQRRRYVGERAFDDRPAPPLPWALRARELAEEFDPEGILI
jgi:membrane associated rhomboid family serine protease